MGQHKGIYWDKNYKKYHVRISVDGKQQHVGRFEDLDDAIRARDGYLPLIEDNLASFIEDDDDYYFPIDKTRPRRTKAWLEAESKRQLKELPARYT